MPATTTGGSLTWDATAVLTGVGPRMVAKLASQGLHSLRDLLRWQPDAYRDHRRRDRIDTVANGALAIIEATVRRFREQRFGGRYIATLELVQTTPAGPQIFIAKWFHRVGGLAQRAVAGHHVRLIGKVQRNGMSAVMMHPQLHDAATPLPDIEIHYPEVEGVGPTTLARLCREALARFTTHAPADPLPAEIRQRLGLMPLHAALHLLHDPAPDLPAETWEQLHAGSSPAHRRLLFDDLLHVQLALLRQRAAYRAAAVPVGLLSGELDRRERLRACVPFEPTLAQWQAIDEIEADLAAPQPMLRLIHGDVGAGKTLVAFAAALGVIDAGAQVVLMAPTEVLAHQHHQSLGPWCTTAGVRLGVLTGATPRGQRNQLLAAVAAGQLDLLIGTHAVLGDALTFRRLGLVIIDEQHRFGVRQRALLRDKGSAPHLLVMTATPIPRSLALTLFGELDVSVLDTRLPGRRPAETRLFCGPRSLASARATLVKHVLAGRAAFVVCPQVEAGIRDVSDVEATAADLRARLPKHAVGVVHGRMAARDKDAMLAAFRAGELAVLVATTVIEVGVDIPAAEVMLIEHADCFGLAQLHQLRGRIGRSNAPATAPAPVCLLHTATTASSSAASRLQVLVDTDDGFKVAERDLAERGAGELFGLRQAGATRHRLAGLAGELTHLLEGARSVAQELLSRDPELTDHPELAAELAHRARAGIIGGDAG